MYKSIETDLLRLNIIEAKYLSRKKTQKGAISPPFSYENIDGNIDGNIVTNEDLKGKYVYIDLWATWCGPCLREIPYFDTLQTVFEGQNITFVSICQNDTKERWKATVAKKELKGVQLFAEDDGGQFYEDYQVTGIPRYILIDPLGKIVNSDAKRPSDKRLVAELESLVK
jgi:thiol-disulfide isomerase/thioredoxin